MKIKVKVHLARKKLFQAMQQDVLTLLQLTSTTMDGWTFWHHLRKVTHLVYYCIKIMAMDVLHLQKL
jgi:hypothetical protein